MEYLYYCANCDHSFDVKKSMAESSRDEQCPQCELKAGRRFTPLPFSFGWRLTEQSHISGPDELERDI